MGMCAHVHATERADSRCSKTHGVVNRGERETQLPGSSTPFKTEGFSTLGTVEVNSVRTKMAGNTHKQHGTLGST